MSVHVGLTWARLEDARIFATKISSPHREPIKIKSHGLLRRNLHKTRTLILDIDKKQEALQQDTLI